MVEKYPLHRTLAVIMVMAMTVQMTIAGLPGSTFLQEIVGGAIAFRGQDIMGGAAIVFQRPQRVRDVLGGASMLIVKRQTPPVAPRVEIARNRPADRRPGRTRSVDSEATARRTTDTDKGEAFKNQGNTYYDLGQYAQAIEAYQNALKHTPNDPLIYNNLGAG